MKGGLCIILRHQIILRSEILHHFYLPKVIIQVQTGLEYSAGWLPQFPTAKPAKPTPME